MTDKITVLLVDDHTLLRAGLRALLSTEAGIEVVGEAGDGEEAITQARASIPDVVIMDISMPRLNGIDATRRLLAESPASKVIALSVHSSKRFVEDMLKAGAAGYLLKESVPEDMVAAIHAVMGGHGYLSPAIAGTVMSAYRDQVTKTQSTWAQSPRSEHSTQAAEDFDAGSALLQTKLHRPPLGQDLVPRLRLLENLEQGCTRALTLVSAPAGYGKSMLLSSWLETSKRLAAWVSLDEGESDLAQFIRYLVAGVRTLFSGAMQRTLALINAPNLPPMQVLEATLANELDGVEQPFIVVLDDYHRIRNQAVHDLLSALLCHPPRRLHLVLASRRDPPLPIAMLRVGNRVNEIRVSDLRFSVAETANIIERLQRRQIDSITAETWTQKTEGWVTGLRLLMLSLGNDWGAETLPFDIKGTDDYVTDYLISEVLANQPALISQRLLRTSIMDRFCADLCNVLAAPMEQGPAEDPAERITGDAFIDWLKVNNLFLIPLDNEGRWFRFHHLFQDLLRNQLQREASPDEIAVLHAQVSDWFASQQLVDEAIDHALAAGEVTAAAQIVEQNRVAVLNANRWHDLAKWLAKLPAAIKQQRVGLLLARWWVAYHQFRVSELAGLLQRVEAELGKEPTEPALAAELYFFRGYIAFWLGDPKQGLAAFEEAMTLVPQHSVGYLRGDAKLLLVLSLYVCGRGQDAGRSINAELEQGSPPEYMVRSRMIYGQAAIRLLSGELNGVNEPARSLIESAQRIGAQMVEAWGHYFLGIAAFHSGKLEFAQRQFSQVANMRYIAHAKAAIDSIAGLAIISQLLARPDEADEALRLAHELAKQIKDPGLKDIVNACQARVALLRGDLESAMRWQRSFTESTPVAMMFLFLENPGLTECRILIATASQASLRKVSGKLKQLRTAVETRRYTGQLIEILALQALAAEAQARREDALTILIEAVRMAAPGGWIRPFTEPGKPMITLLNALLARSPNNDAPVRRLMDAVMASTQADETGATYTLASQGCTDSAIAQGLTEREWDILPLIAQRLQNKEIANLLDVSPETIKTHLKNLYQKLHIGTRRQAVAKAQVLLKAYPRETTHDG